MTQQAKLISVTNWNYSQYVKNDTKAFISMGATTEKPLFYSVTILQGEYKELGSKDFDSLSSACLYLNKNFRNWTFQDLSQKTDSSSGCSSCSAH